MDKGRKNFPLSSILLQNFTLFVFFAHFPALSGPPRARASRSTGVRAASRGKRRAVYCESLVSPALRVRKCVDMNELRFYLRAYSLKQKCNDLCES